MAGDPHYTNGGRGGGGGSILVLFNLFFHACDDYIL